MRLFTALYPPDEALEELRGSVERSHTALTDLRWEECENWHVTLLFLGEVPDDDVAALTRRLGRVVGRHPAMDLSLADGGAFPKEYQARVVWAGLHGDTQRLTRLANALRRHARRAGISVDPRPYTPHLTLARSRRVADVRSGIAPLREFSGLAWTAREIRLVQSRADAHPRYRPVATWPLAAWL